MIYDQATAPPLTGFLLLITTPFDTVEFNFPDQMRSRSGLNVSFYDS